MYGEQASGRCAREHITCDGEDLEVGPGMQAVMQRQRQAEQRPQVVPQHIVQLALLFQWLTALRAKPGRH